MVQDACVNSIAKCVINASISDLTVISDSQVAGNEVAKVTALYKFTCVGRNPSMNPLGDFTTPVPSFDVRG
jgi:hypothetical protein